MLELTGYLLWSLMAGSDVPATATCGTAAECNRKGSEAYQAGRSNEASALFSRQIDFAETDQRDAGDGDEKAQRARDLALNNAALAQLQGGECRKAAAYLGLADPQARATQANLRQLQKRCAAPAAATSLIGDYWQYAGHGAWNTITLRPTGDETLSLDAFWMRISRGPLDLYGLAAFGELTEVAVVVDGANATGRYEGIDSGIVCIANLTLTTEHLDILVSDQPECAVGGAGAILTGRYQRVSTEPSAAAHDASDHNAL